MSSGRPPGGPVAGDRDDRTLLRDHVAGDREAFGLLFARHRDRLWAVALRTCGDPEDAADALQDAMVSAFRRAETFRQDSAVTTWLHRIVVNACLDRLRRRAVRRAEPLPAEQSGDDAPRAAEGEPRSAWRGGTDARATTDPADLVLERERREAVVAALRTLPVEQRTALVLVDMTGHSVQEAAAILDCAPGTVKSRCARGRARLAPLLAPPEPAAPDDGNPPVGSPVQPRTRAASRRPGRGAP